MYTRITTYHCIPEKLEEATKLAEELKPQIMGIPGLKHWFSAGNEDGNCAVIAVYESREAAEAAAETARALFGRFAEYMDSEPQPQGYEVMLHGSNP